MGIAGPVFIDGRVNSQVYIQKVLPIIAFQVKNRKTTTNDPTTTRMVPNVRNFIFQQDLAPSHTSNATQKYLQDNLPKFLPKESTPPAFVEWPIEMFWNEIKSKVYSNGKPKNMEELKSRIKKEFHHFDFNWLTETWNTMQKRMKEIIRVKGKHTKY